MTEVGISELRMHLSQYFDRVREGEEITVTHRGTPIARIAPAATPRPYDRLVNEGIIERAPASKRTRPAKRAVAQGPVSELAHEQRR